VKLEQALLELLERRVGLRLTSQAAAVIAAFRELERRLELSEAALLLRLESDAALLEDVASGFVIPETHFFRVSPQIEALRAHVIPALLEQRRAERRLRLWSAGCSTGEEAYTLAMLLSERLHLGGWDVSVLGTDLHAGSLEVARAAHYGAWSFRDTPNAVRERHFEADDSGWRVRAPLKRLVRFERLNLLESRFALPERFDLILCRNVTIYFDAVVAQAVYARLGAQLNDDGWLMLGPSDPPPQRQTLERAGLSSVYLNGAIAYHKTLEPSGKFASRIDPPIRTSRPSRVVQIVDSKATLELPPDIVPLEPVPLEPVPLEPARPDPPEPFLSAVLERGLAHLEADQLPEALEVLRRAVYLEPNSALAQFAFAQVLQRSGQATRAVAALRQARAALTGLEGDAKLGAGFTVSDLRRAVRALSVMLGVA
jgi:chemotaxis protein methyltransferase CheR